MRGPLPDPNLEVVELPGALAVFADRSVASEGATEAELALGCAAALAALVGRAVPVLYAFQVHSPVTFVYAARGPLPPCGHLVGDGDGLITAEPWVALQVRNADCLPVALAGGGVVAMLHAGWKGLAGDILGRAVARIRDELGVEPGHLEAVIGVGVRACHYPVGDPVVAALARLDTSGDGWRGNGRVDLSHFAAGRLAVLGVRKERIRVLPGCTACSPRYHSFRRDGERAGRQWGAIALTPGRTPAGRGDP